MKHQKLRRLFGIFAVLACVGCASGPVMTGSDPTERPEWVVKFPAWRDAEYKKNGDGKFYFIGIDKRIPKEVAKDNKPWTYQDAYVRADQAAKKSVAELIFTQIETEYKEETSQKGGILKEDVETVTKSMSFGAFQGLQLYEMYTEEWQETIKKKPVSTTYVWLLFSVPRESIESAQKIISDDLADFQERKKAARDAEQKKALEKEILEKRMADQEERFYTISRKFDELKIFLDKYQFENENENEKQLDTKFNELLSLYSDLLGLDLMGRRNDKAGQDYNDLKRKIESTRDDYGFANRQRKMIANLQRDMDNLQASLQKDIDNLERDIIAKDATITELRRQNESISSRREPEINQGYTVQSQTIIISFPQKPQETAIPALNILAAAGLVSNLDYISFTSVNRINNLAKAEQGLDAPVTSVTWNEAARYCNWLSKLYRLTPCYDYDETQERITGYDRRRNGYRLPEEREIQVMLQEGAGISGGIINENDFAEYGIWSSSGFPREYTAYKLSRGTGRAVDRLMKKTDNSETSDWRIGFRVVRNAQ